MKNKTIIIFAVLLLITVLVFVLILNKSDDNKVVVNNMQKTKKIKIAACPSCYSLGKRLDSDKYEFIKTRATAESLFLISSGQVYFILAGKTLKSDEPELVGVPIGEGYSFLS
jgi:Flp pilus assembly protein CpaB